VRRHPKAITQAVNITSALIAFNQEITGAVTRLEAGDIKNIPGELLFRSVGIDGTGHIDSNQLMVSVTSKVGGYAFNKLSKFFLRRFRM